MQGGKQADLTSTEHRCSRAALRCFIQRTSIGECFTPTAQRAAGSKPEANKRKHDRACVSQSCSKTEFPCCRGPRRKRACGWELPGSQPRLLHHPSPAEPARPYARARGGAELQSPGTVVKWSGQTGTPYGDEYV